MRLRVSPVVVAGLVALTTAARGEEGDGPPPGGPRSTWNEHDNDWFNLRIGGGLLVDYADYVQDDVSEAQLDLSPALSLRDLRFVANLELDGAPWLRPTAALMFDAAAGKWRVRQTGLRIAIEALDGELFIGRTKEGFSTNKLMVGYDGWTLERAAANEAFIQLLGDGARWTGRAADGAVVYNVGLFADRLSDKEPFNRNDEQGAARVVWLPWVGSGDVLHLAVEGRYGTADDGQLHLRSKPEAFGAQSQAVDTGEFAATGAALGGVEAYVRKGAFVAGVEYFFDQILSDEADDPFFHGGEVILAWILTGESRPYNEEQAVFQALTPSKGAMCCGDGAWELVLRISHVDLDGGTISGGRFTRVTPALSWYLTNHLRLEFSYGYAWSARGDEVGETQFFQTRLALTPL